MSYDKKNPPESWQSDGRKNDSFSKIYDSMLCSPIWQSLSPKQQMTYICMANQYYGKRKPRKDYANTEIAKLRPEILYQNAFYFSWHDAKKYGLYKEGSKADFYRNIHVLEEKGFIRTIINGKPTRTKSIYVFSADWKSKKLSDS